MTIVRFPTVRVTKNGNARTLAVPAAIAESQHIDTGDEYVVQPVGRGDLLYRRSEHAAGSFFVGSGADRTLVAGDNDAWPAGRDQLADRGIDWSF